MGRGREGGRLRRERAEGRWDGPASSGLKVAACCSSSTSCECATRISKTSAYGTEHSAASSTSSAGSPPSGAPFCLGGFPARFPARLALAPPALAPPAVLAQLAQVKAHRERFLREDSRDRTRDKGPVGRLKRSRARRDVFSDCI